MLYEVITISCTQSPQKTTLAEPQVFPHKMPESKPDYPMSAATARMFRNNFV